MATSSRDQQRRRQWREQAQRQQRAAARFGEACHQRGASAGPESELLEESTRAPKAVNRQTKPNSF
jgi:hypothetical protein